MDKKSFTSEEAKQIGETLGIDWSKFDIEQFRMGMDVELEHGTRAPLTNVTNDDPIMTCKIALAHLNEYADYYTRLNELEKQAEDFWKKSLGIEGIKPFDICACPSDPDEHQEGVLLA